MRQIKAIQTRFDGILFRSRTEARWAVFFTTAGIEYQYEPEGYDLGGGLLYLPDFFLPWQDCFFEVKGVGPTEEESNKALALADGTGKKVFVAYKIHHPDVEFPDNSTDSIEAFFPGRGWDNQYCWCQCRTCGRLGIEFNARSARIKCGCEKDSDKDYNVSDLIRSAYAAAISARFGT